MPERTIGIALAQMAVETDHEANVGRGLDLMTRAHREGASAICFSELSFLPFFPHARADSRYFEWAETIPGPTVERFQDAAREKGLVVVLNVYERTAREDFFDTTAVIGMDGSLLGTCRMAHIAENAAFNEKYYYWPGDSGYPVFHTDIGAIGVATCHDRNFPEVFRSLALNGAAIVFVPTAYSMDAYLRSRAFYEIPQQAASMANGIYTICVNRVGPGRCVRALSGVSADKLTFCGASFATSPSGEVVARAKEGADDLAVATVSLQEVAAARMRRPFFRDRRPETYSRLMMA